MPERSGVWMYAVARRLDPPEIDRLAGVGREPLRTIDSAGLTAVVGTVDLDEFGEEALRRKLDDLDSLDAIARAHHDVVAYAARRTPTVPMRLATVYEDDAGVEATLAELHDDLLAALDRVTGRTEWGVKAYAEKAADATESAEGESPSTRPGTAYLLRRRAQLSAVNEARTAAVRGAQDVHETLSSLAVAARLHAPQDPQLTGEKGLMVLNSAYLIDEAEADSFAAEVRSLSARHPALRLELTGPWPAYSFAAVEDRETT